MVIPPAIHLIFNSTSFTDLLHSTPSLVGERLAHLTELVILVRVKEARNLSLQPCGVARLTHGNRMAKEVPLKLPRQIVPVHDYRRTEATQHMLLLLGQGSARLAVALRLRLRNSTLAFPSGKGSAGTLFWTSRLVITHAGDMGHCR